MSLSRRKSYIRAAAERQAALLQPRSSEPIVPSWREVMVGALRGGKSVSVAARAAGVSRAAAYKARQRDAVFASAWDEAAEAAFASRRNLRPPRSPFDPIVIPYFYGGLQRGVRVRYDDGRLFRALSTIFRARKAPNGSTTESNALTEFLRDVP